MNTIEATITKIYDQETSHALTVFKDLSITIPEGEFVCIMGPSGSGKTTLLNILSLIDTPTNGKVMINGKNTTLLKGKVLAKFRKTELGFIFQNYNLMNELKIRDNILFSLRINKVEKNIQEEKLKELSELLDITEILDKYPFECSGGQQQKAAIARALIHNPKILFCDEPTGNLDSHSSKKVMEFIQKINKQYHITVLLVTHDNYVASFSSHLSYLKDGKISSTLSRDNKTHRDYYNEIVSLTSDFGMGDD